MTVKFPKQMDELIDAFEDEWRLQGRPDIASYLEKASAAMREALLRELMALELEYRLRAGEPARVEECLRRFPALQADVLELIVLEFRVRQDLSEQVTVAEYVIRFPTLRDTLPTRLAAFQLGPPEVPGFEILEELGRGGMGVVYRAVDAELRRSVAVKLMAPGQLEHADAVARFVEEARIAGRLQHPGVAPVHRLGTLSDGQPFLAMKLIQGQTLAELLVRRTSPDADLPRYLQIFESVCQTVAYAHEQGIVHRDLKPSNVMVGAFGEVQVMDWGLAKEIGSVANVTLSPSLKSPTRDTQTGTILGTPAYMPPEQALGDRDRVDARADVFALGAILCEILTGQPPYAGAADVVNAAQNARLESAEKRLNACRADAELVALTRRCLALVPADRPASATPIFEAVTAHRLAVDQKLREAERERAATLARSLEERKRRRVLLIAAGLLIVILAGGIVGTGIGLQRAEVAAASESRRADNEAKAKENEAEQRGIAEKERDRAARARDQVLAALDATTTSITSESFARQKELSAGQKKFLNEVLPLYRELAKEKGTDRKTREHVASAAQRVGSIEYWLGRFEASVTALRLSKQEYEALAAEVPADSVLRKQVGRISSNLAVLLPALGMSDEALINNRASIAIFERLNTEFLNDPALREGLADAEFALGLTLFQGDEPAASEAHFQKAVNLQGKLVADFPHQPRHVGRMALNRIFIGMRLDARGKPSEAKKQYDTALAMLEKLREDFPEELEHRPVLALAYDQQANFLLRNGSQVEAEREFRRATLIRERLVIEAPGVAEYRHILALSQVQLGKTLADSGNHAGAEEEYRKALVLRERLTQDYPAVPEYRARWADNHDALGNLFAALNKPLGADEHFRKAIAIREQLTTQFPAIAAFHYDLSRSHGYLGHVLARLEKHEDATKTWQQGVRILEKLIAAVPVQPTYRRELAMLHGFQAYSFSELAKPADAEDRFKNAIGILERLTVEFPDHQLNAVELGRHYFLLGCLKGQHGTPAEGLQWLDKATATLEAAVRQEGKSTQAASTVLQLIDRTRPILLKKLKSPS